MGVTDKIVQEQVSSMLEEVLFLAKTTQDLVRKLTTRKHKAGAAPVDPMAIVKMNKAIAETLEKVHKIMYGRAAQEEIMQKIGELQRHMDKVEQINSERERRARSKPLVEVVGQLAAEAEIRDDSEDEPETTRTMGNGDTDAQLQAAVDRGLE